MNATAQHQQQQISDNLKRIQQVTSPQEATAKLTVSPTVMVYEARFALQQLREVADPETVITVVEPLARAIGWAEGLAFAFDRTAGPITGQTNHSNQ